MGGGGEILIKGGTVYDGTGTPPVVTDVLVRDGAIARVGNTTGVRADRIIRASNAVVAPGFIDINTGSDHFLTLFSDPPQSSLVRQGVTTIIGGNCGASLAPLLGTSLAAVGEWGHPTHVNTNWHTVGGFLETIDRLRPGINFGTLVGHETIRRAITGDEFRDLTDPELRFMNRVLSVAFRDGAFGFSSGTDRVGSASMNQTELAAFVQATTSARRVYAVHLRDFETGVRDSVNEILELARRFHANVEFSHLMPRAGFSSKYTEALEAIERAAGETTAHFDVYPFDFLEEPFYTLLPAWAQRGGRRAMLSMLEDSSVLRRIIEHLSMLDPNDFRFGHVFETAARFLEGKPFSGLSVASERSRGELFLHLMKITNLKATVVRHAVDGERLSEALWHPHALIASNAPSARSNDVSDRRSVSTFTTFIERAIDRRTVPLERAIMKLTSVPAEKYRIARRGRIAERYYADVVVLRNDKPTHVLVNGVLAVDEGAATGSRSGRALRAQPHR